MRSFHVTSLIVLFAFLWNSSIVRGQLSEFAPPAYELDEETRDTLNQEVVVHYEETPFADVLQNLKRQLDVEILLDNSAGDCYLDETTPVTFSLSKVRACTVLTILLESWDCTYTIQDGIVRLISLDSAWERMSVRVIDIGDSQTKTETETLADTIVNLVDPDSWEENGGHGRWSIHGDKMIFAQTEQNHRKVLDLLCALEIVPRPGDG